MEMYWNVSSGINDKYIFIKNSTDPVHFVAR